MRARRPWTLACVHGVRRAALPAGLATVAGAVLHTTTATQPVGLDAAAAGECTPWLHLPLLTAALASAIAAARLWPLFAARRPGRDHVARLERGPLAGSGALIAGALLAQFVLTLPLATGYARLLGAPAEAVAHVALRPPDRALLVADGDRLAFAVGGRRLDALDLRPTAGPPLGTFAATRVRVVVDGDPEPCAVVAFEQTLEHVRVPLPGRTVHTLELAFAGGSVPLWFAPGSVVAVEAGSRSGLWNGVQAALVYLLPSFVALALALLCGTAAMLPTVLTVLAGLLFVGTVGGVGPADDAVLALLRGHDVRAAVTFSACIPSLAAGSLAMIGAMMLRRRLRR